ncbi:hypothetical protein [Kaistia adipata]|uniref:hypothetical protein n=1 Tax=Kaistia adipata TaxID=166954 RepID=UPI00040663FC|nr:hypothetical protein [Kaistia adipata]
MKRTLAALSIVTLASVSAIAIAPAFAKPDAPAAAEMAKDGERGEMRRGPHGDRHAGKHEGRGDHDRRGHGAHGPRKMQMWLANNLSATETLIGITADQQDAWRGYTNALLAMFERPARPDVKPGDKADAAKVPFAREERLIQNSTERAAKAGELQKAIDALKAKLTPEQLQKLADAELRFGPPMRGGHGHGPDRGPRGEAPQAAPDGADAPDMPDDAAPQAE